MDKFRTGNQQTFTHTVRGNLKGDFFPLQEANRLENLCCQCYSAEVTNGDGIPSLSYDFTT